MERKEYLELAIKATEVFGDLHLAQEETGSENTLDNYSVKDLHEALCKRAGIYEIEIGLENELIIYDKAGEVKRVSGPACVLINID